MKRMLPPAAFLLCLIAMAGLHFFLPIVQAPKSTATSIVAGLLLLGGLALTVSQALRFDRSGANIKTFDPPTALLTTGPYRFTRNPMYLGFVLALLGVWFFFSSATSLLPVLFFAVICHFHYIPFEEREMSRVHGDAYEAYRQKVRRWL